MKRGLTLGLLLASTLACGQTSPIARRGMHVITKRMASYRASATFTMATGATVNDYFTMAAGSSAKPMFIYRIEKSCNLPTPAAITELLVRRTSETGGTPTTLTDTPLDPWAPAGTALLQHYGSGLTSGNSGGTVFLERWRSPWTTSTNSSVTIRDSWGMNEGRETNGPQSALLYFAQQSGSSRRPGGPLVSRGPTDIIAIFTGTSFGTVPTCTVTVTWAEPI